MVDCNYDDMPIDPFYNYIVLTICSTVSEDGYNVCISHLFKDIRFHDATHIIVFCNGHSDF